MPASRTQIVKLSSSYASLLSNVRKTLLDGQARIEAARVRTYWETGRLIHADILKNKSRAQYGKEVLVRLAKDLNVHESLLNRCVKFAEVYPRLPIPAGRQEFSWSHYRELITIPDHKKRLMLQRNAIQKGWTADELAARIKDSSPVAGRPSPESGHGSRVTSDKLLIPLKGQLYTYQITKRPTVASSAEPELLIDLGFSNFHKIDDRLIAKFSANQIIESRWVDDDYKFYASERIAKDLYTYAAYVEKVIDGDTLKVRVDLGFDTWSRQVLRLRGIDCPEMDTKEGQAAKAFVQSHIKEADRIIIRSSKSDKYDRYLADVWIPTSHQPPGTSHFLISSDDLYLNNLLLEQGYAKRMG